MVLLACFVAISPFMLSSCVGRHSEQPLIINMPYSEARQVILKSGWTPVTNTAPDEEVGARVPHFRELGYVEVDACSGTGMGYCKFIFQNEKGLFLSVITQEAPFGGNNSSLGDVDGAIVVNYGVDDGIKSVIKKAGQ